MNTVIIGAGKVGSYTASLLSKLGHNVILIDKNYSQLSEMSHEMDIAVKNGSGTNWELLDDLLENKPDLFLALTNEDEVNLVSCCLAKHLGYPRTIARVKDNHFLNRMRLDFARLFNADHFISPEWLVAYEIYKYLINLNSISFEYLAHGAVQMRTLRVPGSWNNDKPIKDLQLPRGIMVGLIYRKQSGKEEIIFPHGDDVILPDDEITLMGEQNPIGNSTAFFGIKEKAIKSVIIVGGTTSGVNLAKILQERHISVHIIEKDPQHCLRLAEQLPHCRITNQEILDPHFLKAERVNHADYFVLCAEKDEENILGALAAKEAGCDQIAIVLANENYISLVHQLGINYVASPQQAAAKQILSLATTQGASSLIFLYDKRVEIAEITVSLNSQVIGIPLSELGPKLPKDFLITMIQNRGRITIPKGDSIICPGDSVIVICDPKYSQELSVIF